VNSLGGIDVPIGRSYADECGGTWMTFLPGVRYMDGFTALCYTRMRKSSSDFDRLRRQQEVVMAIFNKAVSLDALSHLPDLYNQYVSLVDTDAGVDDLVPLIPLGAQVASDASRIRRYAIDSNMATGWRVPYSGASVQLPNRDAILAMLADAFPQ
jgi:anionic cell wall polymer biosynthesis LytR-Cps2A-Psr (LCP) family protein